MTHATAIKSAQQTLILARAEHAVFVEALNAALPAPSADCDDATYDAWNDAYEAANLARGGITLERAKTAAEDDLLAAFSAWIRTVKTSSTDLRAVLDMAPTRYSVRVKLLDLAMRLDTQTLAMVA